MAIPILNAFSSFELLEEEELQGQILNQYQVMVMQNRLADFAAQRLALKLDTNKPAEFAQAEAELHGKIDLLTLMLQSSEEAKERLANKLAQTRKSQAAE